MAQAKSGTTKASYLPLNYDDRIHTQLMRTTKIMPNIPNPHKFNHESHLAKFHQRMKNTQNEEFDTHTTILQTKD